MNFDQTKSDFQNEVIISRHTLGELIAAHGQALAANDFMAEALALARNELDAECHGYVIGRIDHALTMVDKA